MTSSTVYATPQTIVAVPVSAPVVDPLAVPTIEGVTQTSTALVPVPQPKKRFTWFGNAPAKRLPFDSDVDRVQAGLNQMRHRLTEIHNGLPNDLWVRANGSSDAAFTGYDTARASAIAAMHGMKAHIVEASSAGAIAAYGTDVYARFTALGAGVRTLDAERSALVPAVSARIKQVAEHDEATKAAKEVAAQIDRTRAEELKNLSGPRRTSLVDRMRELTKEQSPYLFAYYPYNIPNPPPDHDYTRVNAEAVIPSLALRGFVYFGRQLSPSHPTLMRHDDARRLNNLAELEDLIDSLMGRGHGDRE